MDTRHMTFVSTCIHHRWWEPASTGRPDELMYSSVCVSTTESIVVWRCDARVPSFGGLCAKGQAAVRQVRELFMIRDYRWESKGVMWSVSYHSSRNRLKHSIRQLWSCSNVTIHAGVHIIWMHTRGPSYVDSMGTSATWPLKKAMLKNATSISKFSTSAFLARFWTNGANFADLLGKLFLVHNSSMLNPFQWFRGHSKFIFWHFFWHAQIF